ncbi:MAG: Cell division protein FtsL [Firmicutes bacterium ADurb.Bin193]|nr:MAG: Cell division protein FtsL [Firmicutes bacterium ADurb.Bin193]
MRTASSHKSRTVKGKNKKIKLVLVFAVLLYFVWTFTLQQIEAYSRKQELSRINAEIEQQTQLKEELQARLELVNTPEYLESIARKELGYAKPGEIIFFDSTVKK